MAIRSHALHHIVERLGVHHIVEIVHHFDGPVLIQVAICLDLRHRIMTGKGSNKRYDILRYVFDTKHYILLPANIRTFLQTSKKKAIYFLISNLLFIFAPSFVKSLDETLEAADAEPDMKPIPGVMIEGKDYRAFEMTENDIKGTILYAEEKGKIISVTIINSKPDDPEVLTILKSIKVK